MYRRESLMKEVKKLKKTKTKTETKKKQKTRRIRF